VQYLVYNLVTKYGKDDRITALLDQAEFLVIPVVNPDGFEYTWESNRMWRKNRRPNGGLFGGYGVDLNRNFST
jgi:carboxypeptidase A2